MLYSPFYSYALALLLFACSPLYGNQRLLLGFFSLALFVSLVGIYCSVKSILSHDVVSLAYILLLIGVLIALFLIWSCIWVYTLAF